MSQTGSMSREELLALGHSNQPAAFVNSAQNALAAYPEDADLRLLLIQALVQAGLFERAAKLARGFDGSILQRADFAGLVSQLEGTRENGRADWQRYSAQFKANLAAARERFDWVEAMEHAWASANLELHISRDGRWQVFEPEGAWSGRWRPAYGMTPPSDKLEDLKRQAAGQVVSPIIIDGVAFGEAALLFHAATSDTLNGASPYVYIAEPSYLALAVAFHFQDWRLLIADDRVIFCVGAEAYQTMEQEIASRPNAPAPQIIVTSPAWDGHPAGRSAAIVTRAMETIGNQAVAIRREVETNYVGRDAAYWARRYRAALSGAERPLRVLAMTSLYTTVLQYSTRDTVNALSALGCETRLLVERDLHSYISSSEAMSTFREFEPDLVFMIDHTRKTQQNLLIDQIPVMTWIQDRLTWLFDDASGRSMGPLDFCMGLGRDELVIGHQYPGDRFLSCEMATNPAALCEGPGEETGTDDIYACDIAFASHAAETPEAFLEASVARAADREKSELMSAVYWELKSRCERGELNGALDFEHFLTGMLSAVNATWDYTTRGALMSLFVRPLADRFLRHQTIEWASRWVERSGGRLNLYGAGWENHPRFSKYARGSLPHGRELGRAFRGAKINLHAGLNWAFHQRVLDGLTAGGFFLIRRHGADVSESVARRLYEFALARGSELPIRVSPADFEQPIGELFRKLRLWKGRDSESVVEINQRRFEILHRRFAEGVEVTPGMLWPQLSEVTFEDEAEFASVAESFIHDPEKRRRVASEMRALEVDRFGYEALLKRGLEWLSSALETGGMRSRQGEAVAVKATSRPAVVSA